MLVLTLALLAACASQPAPAPATPLPILTPPMVSVENVLSSYRTAVGEPTLAQLAALPPLTVGRPMLAGDLSLAAVRAYRPGQRIDQLVRTGGEWALPILAGRYLVGVAHLDAQGRVVSAGGGFAPGTQPPPISSSYDDPAADVWLVGVPPVVSMLLVRRGSDERLAFVTEGSQPFFAFLDPLTGREVSPEEMMPAVRRAVEQHCTLLLFVKQC
jgi:hypothetical protein